MAQNPQPINPLTEMESSAYSPAQMDSADQPAVLVVDGVAYTRELLAHALSEAGYQTHTASNVRGVLECIAPNVIDLIVMDIEVTGRLGADLLQDLRSQDPTRETPIIVLARSGKKSHVMSAMRHGISGYFIKSQFSIEKFLESLSDALVSRQ